ncbi:MAG: phosphoribosylglycinamide formyltransferase [Ignavibacteria bacterium GWB2_35_6b]|nr:MAG: phosphoribosylglycinamide formyltransferase [Ignavibacteria bacterium GWB2_35_6b]
MYNLSVFVSGRGSNLRALLEEISNSEIRVVSVVTNMPDCGAVTLAQENNIPVYFVSGNQKENFILFDELIVELKKLKVDLVILAGFLKKISDNFVDAFRNKIINIHPALLPSFGGKGMYGINVHKAVFEKSAQLSGATVHFVDKIYDNGKIIAQKSVDISGVESPEEIAERVLKIEHELLPFVVKKMAEGKLEIKNNRVYILN